MHQDAAAPYAWRSSDPQLWWECKPCDVRVKADTAPVCWSCETATMTRANAPVFPGYAGMQLQFG